MAVWQHIYHCVSGLSSVSSENSLGGIANSITDGNLYQKRRFKGLSWLSKSTGPQLQVSGLPIASEAETTLRKSFTKSRSAPSCLPCAVQYCTLLYSILQFCAVLCSRSILAKRSKAANDPSVASQRKSGEVWPLFRPATMLALDVLLSRLSVECSTSKLSVFRLLEVMSKSRSGYISTGTAWGGKAQIFLATAKN